MSQCHSVTKCHKVSHYNTLLILTFPLSVTVREDSDGDQHGAALLPATVHSDHGQDVAPGLSRGEDETVGDDSGLGDCKWLVRTGDGVLTDVTKGWRAILVRGGDLQDEVREDSLLHLGAVLLLAPLRDVLVDILHRHVNIHAEMSSITILTTFKLKLCFFP